jgi:protein SCO1
MMTSSILLSERFDVPDSVRAELYRSSMIYGHAQPSPDELGGVLDFTDWQDEPVGISRFVGRWTLLYFGYSRCTESCKMATPLIVATARALRSRGLAASAAFVDIDAPPLGITRINVSKGRPMRHGHNWEKRHAMRALAQTYGADLMVLTGNRKQLAEAGIAYHVIREHIPPRRGETGHSINHSSMIYFIGPDIQVAGYGYHDSDIQTLTNTIMTLETAPRRAIAAGQFNRRIAGKGCAPTGLKTVSSL